MIWSLFDANSQPLTAMSPLLISGGMSAPLSAGTAWYIENALADTGGSLTFGIPSQPQPYSIKGELIFPGGFRAIFSKFGPAIDPGGIIPAAALPPGDFSVAADSLIQPGVLYRLLSVSLAFSAGRYHRHHRWVILPSELRRINPGECTCPRQSRTRPS